MPLLLSVAVGAVSISATINHDISRKALNLTLGVLLGNPWASESPAYSLVELKLEPVLLEIYIPSRFTSKV